MDCASDLLVEAIPAQIGNEIVNSPLVGPIRFNEKRSIQRVEYLWAIYSENLT